MFDKLEAVEKRYEELTKAISDPEVIANQTEWQKLIKEHSSIEEVVLKYREYKKEKQRMEEAKEMMEDKELKELAEADYYEAKEKLPHIEEEKVMIDMNIVMKYGYNILKTCKQIQDRVGQSVENMTGFEVKEVNIRIAGVSISKDE